MKKEKYDLTEELYFLFKTEKESDIKTRINEILIQTGLSIKEFEQLVYQKQTIGQLKYRILGLMGKKKIDSSHII